MYGFLFFVADTPFFRKGKYMDATVAVQHCGVYDFETVYAAVQQLFVLAPPPDVRGKQFLLNRIFCHRKSRKQRSAHILL